MGLKITRRGLAIAAGAAGAAAAGGAGWVYMWQRGTKPVVALACNGARILDLVGPMEILGRLPDAHPLYAGEALGWKAAAAGPLRFEATETLDGGGARPDVIIVAGSQTHAASQAEISWLREAAPHARAVLAVGKGRELLQAAGLSADGQRIVACEGGSGALDAALAIAARLAGRTYAEGLQLAIEYDPAPPFPAPQINALPADLPALRAGILLYEGMTALDAMGPYEVLSRAPSVSIDLVGVEAGPIRTDTGALHLQANRTIADAPDYDLLIIPGGAYGTLQAVRNEALQGWLRERVNGAGRIMSVCTGALILAQSGALRGETATTHWASRAALQSLGSTYVHERYVEHNRIITAAGVSAGIDVTLVAVGRLLGEQAGAVIQAQLPYAPNPPLHAGAFQGARAEVIEAASSVLQYNARASAVRMNFLKHRH
ncbi:MAG: DJ-1/PfpI family protein [Hyphomonadaceae bacterium]|nr:DJ-1/PfpI family protein [Hyphomonadaceae bacterium]